MKLNSTKLDSKIINQYLYNYHNGDVQSFYNLYVYIKKPLFLYILSIIKDYHFAEDILQELFIKIKNNIKNYNKELNGKSWIFIIAKNLTIDFLKKNNKELPYEGEKLLFLIDTKYQKVDKNNSVEFITKIFKMLNLTEQQILSLHIFSGFKHYEIAAILSIPYSKVRSKYAYILKKIRMNCNKEDLK